MNLRHRHTNIPAGLLNLVCIALILSHIPLTISLLLGDVHKIQHGLLNERSEDDTEGSRTPHHEHDQRQRPLSLQPPAHTLTLSTEDEDASYTILLDALDVMESHFFEISFGTWPDAIDWTAAVMGTQLSATLNVMTRRAASLGRTSLESYQNDENLINRYFTQVTSFYFGENAFSLRTQAYDDMLWVVLGWLESINFIKLHSSLHYTSSTNPSCDQKAPKKAGWYASQFIPQFAHRARLFYDLAFRGWDDALCGGGMIWNPYLAPYKNAITNELYIAASVAMYLYFPGDSNSSPFVPLSDLQQSLGGLPPAKAHDERYLENAIQGYDWLQASGMKNSRGLYTDGFHIRGWRGGRNGSDGTGQCDLRDEKVYTYNQGVILSAQRGLWEATGKLQYLEDGHALIRNVIVATGWPDRWDPECKYAWAGLGRGGVMEEECDWSGTCSQDAQTFKGIYFHHLDTFCRPLPVGRWDDSRPWLRDKETKALHRKSCEEYVEWVMKNAAAANVTRDGGGKFGGWWGRVSRNVQEAVADDANDRIKIDGSDNDSDSEVPSDRANDSFWLEEPTMSGGSDYRNIGVPWDDVWRLPAEDAVDDLDGAPRPVRFTSVRSGDGQSPPSDGNGRGTYRFVDGDINDRGRGRTVETQSGGLAVFRAMWSLLNCTQEM